jgi:hypothetical protein
MRLEIRVFSETFSTDVLRQFLSKSIQADASSVTQTYRQADDAVSFDYFWRWEVISAVCWLRQGFRETVIYTPKFLGSLYFI